MEASNTIFKVGITANLHSSPLECKDEITVILFLLSVSDSEAIAPIHFFSQDLKVANPYFSPLSWGILVLAQTDLDFGKNLRGIL